jgi:hypothetical protein
MFQSKINHQRKQIDGQRNSAIYTLSFDNIQILRDFLVITNTSTLCIWCILGEGACQSVRGVCAWWSILLGIILKAITYSADVHSLPGGIDLWQAGLLFITEYRYILVISTICYSFQNNSQ